jgi:hypothetical protein
VSENPRKWAEASYEKKMKKEEDEDNEEEEDKL